MDENLEITNINNKNRKAFIYAVIATFCIASLYFIFVPKSFYRFSGAREEVKNISDYFKKSQEKITPDIQKGKDLIEETKIKSN